jgi:hypothetical protein
MQNFSNFKKYILLRSLLLCLQFYRDNDMRELNKDGGNYGFKK